jgi:hypothetical protein
MTYEFATRFWSKVSKGDPDDCWEWSACRLPGGYGRFSVSDGRPQVYQYAHRIAWELTHGSPGPKQVLHRCDNPACCNPAHLFLGTQKDNMLDKVAKGRASSKLSSEDVVVLRRLAADGWTQQRIAERFSVHPTTIGSILRSRTWGWTHAA